jgi:copper transport protein
VRRLPWARGLVLAALAALAALALVVLGASAASAHANLIGADPAPGASLPQAPGAVVLRFSEAVDHLRSTINVTGPGGREATSGPTQAVATDSQTLRRPLGLEPPGVYQVAWTSVSIDDGHTETGRYRFGIGAPAPASQRSRGGAVASEGLLGLVGQLLVVAGLTMWAGALILGRTARRAGVDPARLRATRQAGPTLTLIAAVMRMAAAAARAPALSQVVPTILAGRAGGLGTMILAAAGAIGWLARGRLTIAAPAAAVALTAHAAAGHAGAAPHPVVAVVVLVVHLAAAGVWVFAIVAAVLASRVRRALTIFSPYAVASATTVAITGAAGAALERIGPGQLLTTGYGRVLLAKAAIFLVVAGLGGWQANRRRRRSPAGRLKTAVRLEAAAIAVALIVATLLAGSAPPTRFRPVVVDASDSVLGPLDGKQAVTIADATGPYVVGLLLSAAHAGPVEVRVQILATDPDTVFSDVSIHATAAGGSATTISLAPVAAAVFAGHGRIEHNGDWSFGVSFQARSQLNEVTLALTLPVPDGASLLANAFAAEERLTSVRVHETLRRDVATAAIGADYQFQAPDSFSFNVEGTHEIDIGAMAYRQDHPNGPWLAQSTGVAFGWPSPYFRQAWAYAAAARVVGTDIVDGVPSHIVAFVRPDLPAWFELWIGDSDGLVRREEMRAEGHLMRHDYSGFDAPAAIVAPR